MAFLVQVVSATIYSVPDRSGYSVYSVSDSFLPITILVGIVILFFIFIKYLSIQLAHEHEKKTVTVIPSTYESDHSFTPQDNTPEIEEIPFWDRPFLSAKEREAKKKQYSGMKTSSLAFPNSTPQFSSSTAAYQHYVSEIEKISTLRDKGLMTYEEFEAKKNQILGIENSSSVSASPSQKEHEQSTNPAKTSPDDGEITKVLKMRYAKGEITFEEYREIYDNLKK
ncbi:SHOCT domain-containing protein [Methanoregula sp.]|jgi:uncharacterized membrane protein|uniref:SHOCT domain-containing protein n=1 Tax=Methanoregula sp. TaxID=2052170 RepID=UPI003C1E0639